MVSPLSSFLGAQERGLGIERQKITNQQASQMAPLQLQSQQMNLSNAQLQRGVQEAQLLSNTIDAIQKIPDINQRYNTGVKAAQELKRIGINLPIDRMTPEDFTDDRLMQHKAALTGFVQDPRAAMKNLTSFQRDLDTSVQGLTGAINPATQKPFTPEEARREILLREKGIKARAGTTTGTERIAQDPNLTTQVAGSKAEIKDAEKRAEGLAKTATDTVEDAFKRVVNAETNIRNIDRAISALDRGAKTGAVQRFLPSITAASRELEQIRNELGLDVVGSVTFGALSEGELGLALDTALPTGLDEPQLKDYLQRKKEAQQKLIGYLDEQIQFLEDGGTVGEWRAFVKGASGSKGSSAKTSVTQTQNVPPVNQQGWRLMTDAQGNRAYVSPDGSQFEEVR